MKVKIEFTVDIDPSTWALEFGIPRHEIRDDVKQYTKHLAHQALDAQNLLI